MSGLPTVLSRSRARRRSRTRRPLRVVIVGAGLSGIAMALAMERDGHAEEVLIVDAAEEFGGTWRVNTYPGCACDVPSAVYSLAGEPYDWPRVFSEQPDIQRYVLDVVEAHGLRARTRLGTRVTRQSWDAETRTWTLEVQDGDPITADVVINAVGPLSRAILPDIPGRDDFAGPAFHTAAWRHDVDLDGLRVGIVGTGASAVQVIPSIVDRVGGMTVFQRTPSWVLPKPDRRLSRAERAFLRRVPGAGAALRAITYQVLERVVWRMLERDPRVADRLRSAGRWNIRRGIEDPGLRAAVTPTIEPGCKRLMMSNTYYPALAREHVTLETTAIEAITASGVRLTDGREVPLDVIVWGTGFDAHTFWAPMEVLGEDGVRLEDAWKGHGAAYNSIATPGFPNHFFLLGPNSGTGHNSVVIMAEAQADHIVRALRVLRRSAGSSLVPTAEAADTYAREMAARHADLVWASGCGSWYLGEDGVNDTLYPGTVTDYRRRLATFDLSAYEIRHDARERGRLRRAAS